MLIPNKVNCQYVIQDQFQIKNFYLNKIKEKKKNQKVYLIILTKDSKNKTLVNLYKILQIKKLK